METNVVTSAVVKSPATDLTATGKEIVLHQLGQFSDDATLNEIVEQLRMIAAVRVGLAEAERGEGMPIEEFKKEMATWHF